MLELSLHRRRHTVLDVLCRVRLSSLMLLASTRPVFAAQCVKAFPFPPASAAAVVKITT